MTDAADPFAEAPCGYARCDASGLVLEANAELLRLLGAERDDVVGTRTLPSLVSTGGRIYFESHIFPLLELQGAVREVALDVVRADGTRVPVLLNANASRSPAGGVETIRAVFFPAQDRRRYEVDLLEAVHAAEEARRVSAVLAHTLQQTLIPPKPARIDGLQVGAAYRPAGDGSEVGGDFFDVFQVGQDEWVLVVGDVMGKGVDAAMVTAFVRHSIRDLAMQVPDPAELLARLDRDLAAHPTERLCTVVLVRLTREDDQWSLSGAAAGHPLPLRRAADGAVSALGGFGSILGTGSPGYYSSFHHQLTDDVVVLYTDGVTDARRGDEPFDDHRLVELVRRTGPDVHLLTQTIVEAVLTFQDGDAHDDIAVLTIRAGTG